MKEPKTFRESERFTVAVTRVIVRGHFGKMRMEADEEGLCIVLKSINLILEVTIEEKKQSTREVRSLR